MPANALMTPFGVDINLIEGIMHDHDRTLTRRASAMSGYYADEKALKAFIAEHGNPIHYEVFEKAIPQEYGHLVYCISMLQPGSVGGECFMTKGHYHTVAETAELYLAIRGRGYMMMKTATGECTLEPMQRGRLVYVPPYWAHRSINTGGEPLVSLCIYPGEAGHNYGDIEREGFPKRVFVRGGRESIETC